MRMHYPSFKGLKPANGLSSSVKKANKSIGTSPELKLWRELRKLHLQFKNNVDCLPGRPDIVFSRNKLAVFCDGDFWHGRDWRRLRRKLLNAHNGKYWAAKIERNIVRDKDVEIALNGDGWRVIRFWETDINRKSARIAEEISELLKVAHGHRH